MKKVPCFNLFSHPRPVVDASYKDPIGDLPARPKTAARRAGDGDDDEWGDVDDDLLPE